MHGKLQADRNEAMNTIMEDQIEDVVQTETPEGKYWRTEKNFAYVKRQYHLRNNSVISNSNLFHLFFTLTANHKTKSKTYSLRAGYKITGDVSKTTMKRAKS